MSTPKYFNGQSLLDITLETGYDLSLASTKKICYKSPSGKTGSWDATASGTKLTYSVQEGDINEPGTWKLQSYIIVSGRDAHGSIVQILIDKPIYQPI
jgi:hypothetical protein